MMPKKTRSDQNQDTRLPPSGASEHSLWGGDGLLARSTRFTLTIMAPMAVGLAVGADVWIAYALLACILSYMIDTGGTMFQRLAAFAVAALVVVAGGVLGTLARGDPTLITIVLASTAMLYGLTEGCHPSAASATRFLCLTAAIASLYAPLQVLDVGVVVAFAFYAWLLSVGWDAATGIWRRSTAPKPAEIVTYLEATRGQRWLFATIVGLAVAGALLAARALGLEHPNWAILALVVVLHADAKLSVRLIVNLLAGTVLGVAVAWASVTFFTSPPALLIGMTIAALIRWPAQQLHGALGLGAMAVFVILLLQLVGALTGQPSHAPVERLIDVSLGCGFSIAALWVNNRMQDLFLRCLPNWR